MHKPIDEQSVPELANTCKLRGLVLSDAARDYARSITRATAQGVCHAMRELTTAMARLERVQNAPGAPKRYA